MATAGASIQIEEGNWSKLHNAIWEALAVSPLTGGEFRCLMFLFRKTYGYNKKEDKISLAQWSEGTGMKRQNVWNLLQSLVKRNVIYVVHHGEKRPSTWGFNKYTEGWTFESVMPQHDSSAQSVMLDDYKSVMVEHDSLQESVMPEDYRENPSVMPQHDKSVIPPHEHTKDKKESSLLAANVSDDAMALMRLAYETVCKIGPATSTEGGRANLIAASSLVERFGYPACIRGLSTLRERNSAMIKKNWRGIAAPIAYLRTIMENDIGVTAISPTVLDFAEEELV